MVGASGFVWFLKCPLNCGWFWCHQERFSISSRKNTPVSFSVSNTCFCPRNLQHVESRRKVSIFFLPSKTWVNMFCYTSSTCRTRRTLEGRVFQWNVATNMGIQSEDLGWKQKQREQVEAADTSTSKHSKHRKHSYFSSCTMGQASVPKNRDSFPPRMIKFVGARAAQLLWCMFYLEETCLARKFP